MSQKTISLLICALGGEGAGVLTEWIMEAAKDSDLKAQSTSIPGVAQRTGATTYYLEVFKTPIAQAKGLIPLFSLTPMPARLDGLLSSELLESARQCTLGFPSAKRTLSLSSSARTITTQERMELGDGRLDEERLRHIVTQSSRESYFIDMQALAKREGTIVSSVMLGVIAASELFPINKACYERVVSHSSSTGQASLRGFHAGFEALKRLQSQTQMVHELMAETLEAPQLSSAPLPPVIEKNFPPPTHSVLALGFERLVDYDNERYAELYLRRMQSILDQEKIADPGGNHQFTVTLSAARWLALWMAFEDIIRVADLKSRSNRWLRVKKETKAAPSDLIKVYDHFKPGVAELAALLPKRFALQLLAWERKRTATGARALALPLKIGTHTVLGFAALRFLASLKGLRKYGFRYQEEHSLIEEWLLSVKSALAVDHQLGLEVAQCGQLIKGYGKTNERGKANLIHILKTLASSSRDVDQRIEAIAAIRSAALKDESGLALDQALLRHGAPAREIQAQPIRWMKKPKA